MLIIKVKEGEKIERALKRYKNKHRKTKVINEVRDRKNFKKKSVKRREEKNKAIYIQSIKNEERD
jgi:small subunit ribosomal protein S21